MQVCTTTDEQIRELAEWLLDDGPKPSFAGKRAVAAGWVGQDPSADGIKNFALATPAFCEEYRESRFLGLSRDDSAASLGILPRRLDSLLTGDGLLKKTHLHLIQTEIMSNAVQKKRHLEVLRVAAEEGKWQAALRILERTVPEYSAKQQINVTTQDTQSTEDYEKLARAAQEQLKRLRERQLIK